MKRQIDNYFAEREEAGKFATFAGMLRYIGITKRTYYRYMDIDSGDESIPEEDRYEYRKIFEDAALRREDYLESVMVSEPKLANGCMNSLKQQQNGGFKDRVETDMSATLNINLTGVGGEGAFK